ncbi:hypothetical protein QBC42DRAFT_347861 [Cladorrhinum samala]|uniref:Leucine rich repeat domain containing protein n=1 Tax=Cladorrhinum samala TaxID=585594 RepID=A0AAV9HKZ9_9PEZI|nr:hypothetical protein QBC42DRAFT_347861 [Cladorrhinum samala]
MAHPPSYQDATRRQDWLELVAPYIPISEYWDLCQVSKRFHAEFAPRLWNDPVVAGSLLNRDNDLEWFYGFLAAMRGVRKTTRALVHSVDLRACAAGTLEFSVYATNSCRSLRELPFTFPELRCLLLDGHSNIDIGALAGTTAREPPLLLSIAQCQLQLPTQFFASPLLRNLVYLDVSDMPGSLKGPLVQKALSRANLPALRILKAQGREMDDSTASLLLATFKEQLWSLDLSRNKVTDKLFGDLHNYAFPAGSLRGGHAEVEGELQYIEGQETSSLGQFCFVRESEWSKTFSHPARFFVDSPEYTRSAAQDTLNNSTRLDGRAKARRDSADATKLTFAGGAGNLPPSLEHIQDSDIRQPHQGITHLHLNDNRISSTALVNLIMRSPGQLQQLECDTTLLDIRESARPGWLRSSLFASATVSGILGAAHIFRPVFSSNLQTLRIHHSLVTQVVTLDLPDVSKMACQWVAETFLLPRAEMAYPQVFVPDMNPRLQSLTLTHIPRWSTGKVIDKLVTFLKLAAEQEKEIQKSKRSMRRGDTATVRGLRHVRLEFDPDPQEDEEVENGEHGSDLDPEELIRLAAEEFSFFGGSWSSSSSSSAPPPSVQTVTDAVRGVEARHSAVEAVEVSEPRHGEQQQESVRFSAAQSSSLSSYHKHYRAWNGSEFTVPVFGGSTTGSQATREYMRLLQKNSDLHEDVRPASPCHVAAGVPEGSYVYEAAWRSMLTKGYGIRWPKREEIRGMKDVLEGIKEFRKGTRGKGLGVHYDGVLEVVRGF